MTDFFHTVVVVGFESKSNPTDDWDKEFPYNFFVSK